KGDTTTDFIERVAPDRTRQLNREELIEAGIAIAMESRIRRRASAKVLQTIPGGWRNSHMPPEQVAFLYGEEEVKIAYRSRRDGRFVVTADDNEYNVAVFDAGKGTAELEIEGRRVSYFVAAQESRWFVHGPAGDIELLERSRFPKLGSQALSGGMTAPMPGSVIATCVKAGDTVDKGQLLVILEAMKMEHRITAPAAGKITELHVAEGEQVANGALLVVVDEGREES
ncbi:MAG: biotin/lipoyl-containing protein, partial [Pseudomonadales bacterium]